MEYLIAIDADSLVYKSCYRHMNEEKDDVNLELAYLTFCGEVGKITSEVFRRGGFDSGIGVIEYVRGDYVKPIICLSPKESFRNRMLPKGVKFRINKKGREVDCGYKANRTQAKVPKIRELKRLILSRLGTDIVKIHKDAEADDYVNYYSREHGAFVAAIDKDVVNSCYTYVFDYNKRTWHPPRTKTQIEDWYLIQTLMGDADDNVPGVEGIGSKTAMSIVLGDNGLNTGQCTFEDIVPYFPSRVDAILSHALVRMDKFNGKEIEGIE
jgi:hypothetical protein